MEMDKTDAKRMETDKADTTDHCVLIVGKSGSGKSTVGNIITMEDKFAVGHGLCPVTQEEQSSYATVLGKRIKVVDTPDLKDADAAKQVKRWKAMTITATVPYTVLYTVRCDSQYSSDECSLYQKIKNHWGNDTEFCQHLVVAFTFGDRVGQHLDQELTEVFKGLKMVLTDAGNRRVIFNSKANSDGRKNQAETFLKLLDGTLPYGDIPTLKKMASGGDDVLRIVMLGKTGAGKSSLGNTLIGKTKNEQFQVGRGLKSETYKSGWKTGCRNGLIIQVVDTPGLCDTHKDEAHIYREVGKSIALAAPGPQVLIFTLRCDRRFTKEEYQAYMTIKQMFSEEMKKYMILIFNGIDTYEDEETETIEAQQRVLQQEISRFDNNLTQMIDDAGGRYLGMKNKKATVEEKEKQANQLIAMMKQLVMENGNQYYSTSLTSKIEAQVNKLAEELAQKKKISKSQAATEVKQNIVEDNVEPGFFDWLVGAVSDGAAAVTKACSVM